MLSLLSIVWSVHASGNDSYLLTLAAGTESNLPRELIDSDATASPFLALGFNASKFYLLGLQDSLLLGAGLALERFPDLKGFHNQQLNVALSYQHRFGLGAYAPELSLGLSAVQANFGGEARDDLRSSLELRYSQRLSPALQFSAGINRQWLRSDSLAADPRLTALGYDPVNGLPFEVFDFENDTAFVAGEYSFASGVLLFAEYRRHRGYVVPSTLNPTQELYKISEAFYVDPAFSEVDWFLYRLAADTDEWAVGVSVPLARDTSLDFGGRWFDIQGRGERDYRNRRLSLTLTRRF